jgi:hypothetical protein
MKYMPMVAPQLDNIVAFLEIAQTNTATHLNIERQSAERNTLKLRYEQKPFLVCLALLS